MGGAHSVSDSSPLQFFPIAKKEINDIFKKIEAYIHETNTYMQSVQQDGSIVKSDDADKVKGYIAKVRATQNILTRNKMKVAFFGRTSNGKSSVINAMLREKILPSGHGHKTVCFLQVEGSDSGESYLVTAGSTVKQKVESVKQLADALCEEKLMESQLVHIHWPKDKCLLLRNEVVFVDCPGIDVTPNLDELIGRYCLDADVFVFVTNAEATLTIAEKTFFRKVSPQLSTPNIFILNNRWDVVASEPDNDIEKVQTQHMERAVEFLVEELKVCTHQEAKERIFFVSAKEALQARLQKQKGLPADNGALAVGFPDRYFEFQNFERKFEECITMSAVRTKFEQLSKRGKDIVSEIRQIMDSTYDHAQQLKTQKAVGKKEIYDKLNFTEQQLSHLKQEMKGKIQQMVEDVKQKVSSALSEEFNHLHLLVDNFNFPFEDEEHVLNMYKKELYQHVEKELGSNLRARLSTALAEDIEKSQREMRERMSSLLPEEKKQDQQKDQQGSFTMSNGLNCDNLHADFQVDLECKYSLGKALGGILVATAATAVTVVAAPVAAGGAVLTGAAVVAGELVVGGVVAATAVIAGGTATVVGGKAVEYVSWTHEQLWGYIGWNNEAKKEELKLQFVAHMTKKKQQIVDSTSTNYSKQVKQELSSTFEQLHDLVNKAIGDMDAKIKTLDKEIKQLEKAANTATKLQDKANNITKDLKIFDNEILKLCNQAVASDQM